MSKQQGKQKVEAKQQGAASSTSDVGAKKQHQLALFDHLPRKAVKNTHSVEADPILHPAIVKLGGLFSRGTIFSDDDRVTSLIAAFQCVVKDYKTPPKKVLREDLDLYIRKQVSYIVGIIMFGLVLPVLWCL